MTGPTLVLKRTFVLSCALCVMALSLWPLSAQILTVQELYADALAKERAVRTALADQEAPPTTIKAARTVVSDFEAIVRRYPTSGFGDDARGLVVEVVLLQVDAVDRRLVFGRDCLVVDRFALLPQEACEARGCGYGGRCGEGDIDLGKGRRHPAGQLAGRILGSKRAQQA